MKIIPLLLLACVLFACTNTPVKTSAPTAQPKKVTTDVIAATDSDSIDISTDISEKKFIKKAKIKRILKYYPEIDQEVPEPPDETYASRGKNTPEIQPEDDHKIIFGCEACQDEYFELYAYFLYKRDGGNQYSTQRKTLIKLYRDINHIMMTLTGGGTYFGHQYKRILGYAEYSVYLYLKNKDDYYHKIYSIVNQKQLYIKSLKQYINDEISNDLSSTPNEQIALRKELFKTVTEIDGLLTEYFYLDAVREFQYSHY
ncbi:hypothetical protein [Mucilaginibacter psychrotolerans]|uniref:DUF4375 domain-containing protein n=1 Tax=Mucilaginibacter psychrotolerans TaxID=1524096 RepID=A0A4Y8S3Q0_9SPHI|nr:hypothetical protein [Mucilaginibacter psychrotolerans]TFF33589.1 hypothetical protein E2R66_25275 [Mucilaginibacter psychrotolerans]